MKTASNWFVDRDITVLDWPADLPDLKTIEDQWSIVKWKMRDTRPNNADELKAAVKATWASGAPQQCYRRTASMPERALNKC